MERTLPIHASGLLACVGLLAALFGPGLRAAAQEAHSPARRAVGVGFDLSVGVPTGALGGPAVGLDVAVQAGGPVVFYAGAASNGPAAAVRGEVQLNLLTPFGGDAWTPFVRGGVTHLRYTRLADRLVDTVAPGLAGDLQELGTGLRLRGVSMELVTVSAGIDFLARRGLHFQLAVGRAMQVGASRGGDDREALVLSGYQAWTFELRVGALFW